MFLLFRLLLSKVLGGGPQDLCVTRGSKYPKIIGIVFVTSYP